MLRMFILLFNYFFDWLHYLCAKTANFLKETLRIKGLDIVFAVIFVSLKVVGEIVRERNFD